MNTYKHTQRGTFILVAMSVLSLALLVIGFAVLKPLLIVVLILVLCGWLFHSLTIEIADGELRWRFGPGLIRKRVPLTEIASAQLIRTTFINGWGIHLTSFGWLYNVSGFDAVAITLRNGKRFALGTDEPQALHMNIQAM